MGVALLFLGYIQEAWPGTAGDGEEKQRKLDISSAIPIHDDKIFAGLSDDDDWPPLCKPMFGWPPAHMRSIAYERRLVHFAASLKNVDFALRDWLDKFENLLRQLYWQEAYVRVEQGYIGTHEFRWKPKQDWIDALHNGRISAIASWEIVTSLDYLETLRERDGEAPG